MKRGDSKYIFSYATCLSTNGPREKHFTDPCEDEYILVIQIQFVKSFSRYSTMCLKSKFLPFFLPPLAYAHIRMYIKLKKGKNNCQNLYKHTFQTLLRWQLSFPSRNICTLVIIRNVIFKSIQ